MAHPCPMWHPSTPLAAWPTSSTMGCMGRTRPFPLAGTLTCVAAVAIAIALVPSALRWEEVLFRRDLLDFFLPMKAAYAGSLLSGEAPFWDPWTLGGQPFFATLQSQVLYPPNLVFLALPLAPALSLFVAFHLAWGGIGAAALARGLGAGPRAALIALVGFETGGFLVSVVDLNNQMCALAWMPWTCLAAWRFGSTGSRRALAAWTACHALTFLAGEPQYAAIGGVASAAVAIAATRQALPVGRRLRRVAAGFGAAVLLSLVACSVQLIPLAELALRSERTVGASFHAGGRHALEPSALAALVTAPTGAWGGPAGVYVPSLQVGWIVMVLAGMALAGRGPARRTLAACVALSLLASMGSSIPGAHVLHEDALPFLRYPIKYACLAALLLPVLAALGAQDLQRRAEGPRQGRAAWIPLALAATMAVTLIGPQRRLLPTLPAAPLLAVTPEIEFLSRATRPDGPRVHAPPLTQERLVRRALHVGTDPARAMRERVELLEGALPMLYRVHATWGASALAPAAQAALLDRGDGPLTPELQRQLRAGWVLAEATTHIPLPTEMPVTGVAALHRLPALGEPLAPSGMTWPSPNVRVGPPGLPPPSAWPGWREEPPGTWTFRPTGFRWLAPLSALGWLILAGLALPTGVRERARSRDEAAGDDRDA